MHGLVTYLNNDSVTCTPVVVFVSVHVKVDMISTVRGKGLLNAVVIEPRGANDAMEVSQVFHDMAWGCSVDVRVAC